MGLIIDYSQLETLASKYGYREDTVNGKRHYVTHDDKDRAVVGPARHRAKGGILSWGSKSSQPGRRRMTDPGLERVVTAADNEAYRTLNQMASVTQSATNIRVPVARPTPPSPQGWRRRFSNWVEAVAYDKELHRAVRRMAVTFTFWVAALGVAAMVIKGASWVVFL